jgi:hypothetical protein
MILLAIYLTRINSGCSSIYRILGVINGVKSTVFYAMHTGFPRALFQIAKKAALRIWPARRLFCALLDGLGLSETKHANPGGVT